MTSAFVTQDAFTGRASSHGNVIARRDGVAFSATRVRTEKGKQMYVERKSRRKTIVYNKHFKIMIQYKSHRKRMNIEREEVKG